MLKSVVLLASCLLPSSDALRVPSATSRPVLRAPSSAARHGAPPTDASNHAAVLAPFLAFAPLPVLADDTGYSQLSYNFVLILYIISFPGIYSLVKRSVKAKVVRKTYEVPGPAADGGRPTRELAGDIVAFFQANNYKITDATDTIVFEGTQAPLIGRAAFLTFCVFICLGSLALVLTIVEQASFDGNFGLGNLWYLSTLISPLAGKYYLDNAERTDQVTVKIITEDDESTSDVVIQGDDEEVERFQKTLDLREKGMIYVKGMFES